MTTPATPTPREPARASSRRPWIAVGVVGVLVALCVGVVPSLASRFARPRVEARLAALSARIGRPIAFGNLEASWRGVIWLDDLAIGVTDGEGAPSVTVGRVRVAIDPLDLLRGRVRPRHIGLDKARVQVDLDDLDAWRDLLARVRGTRERRVGEDADDANVPMMPRIAVTEGAVRLALAAGRTARLDGIEATLVREEGRRIDLAVLGRLAIDDALPVAVSGTGSLHPETGAFLAIDAASPVDVRLPGMDGVSMRLSGLTLDLERAAGTLEAAVRNLRVDGIDALANRWRPGRLAHGGVFQAADVRLTVEIDAADGGWPSRVRSLAIRHGSGAAIVAGDPVQSLAFRGLSVDVDRMVGGPGFRAAVQAAIALDGRSETRLSVDATLDESAEVMAADLALRGPLPVQVASLLHPRLLAWPGARVDLDASLRREGDAISGTANLAAEGLAYFWTRVCLAPVTDVAFDARLTFNLDLTAGTLLVAADPLRVGRAWAQVELDLRGLGAKPRIDTRVRVPSQSCEAVAAAIPRVLIPRLEGALFEGRMDLAIDASVDLSRRGPKGEPLARFEASGDLESCRAVTLGPRVRLKDLEKNRFVHVVREDDLDEPIHLGPATSSYVRFEEIPDFVYQAALATEDMGFFKHRGFMPNLIRRALSMNVQYGWFVYGGSTITQQLVKNLYLSREKTLARKLEEAIIVWQMERLLPKERILELYLNCIEYGKHVYGIRAAAKAYFNKEVPELTPLDAAFIMATKPKPRYAWTVYEKGEFTQWWVDRMQGILQRLWQKMAVIDQRTFLSAAPYLPLFWYPEEGTYRRPYTDPSVVVPQGMPADLPRDEAGAPNGQAEERATGGGAP